MITIECHKGLPIEHESFLLGKYNSFITNCRYIEVYGKEYKMNYVVVYKNNTFSELLVFGNNGDTSVCFNSLVEIDEHVMSECTKTIFQKFPAIKKIHIAMSYKDYELERSYLIPKSNDYVLHLPATIDNFFQQLGSTTRRHLKNYRSRLMRDFKDVRFRTVQGDDIKEEMVDRIIQMNIDRMKYKGIIPGKDESDKANYYNYAKHYGTVSYIEIDGKIVAGAIAHVINHRIFLHVISHDNEFSRYNPGQLCILYIIQNAIEMGLSTFHFLSGDNEYKKRLSAKPHSLFSYFVYREYSFEYFFNKYKTMIHRIAIIIRHSEHAKPLRDMVKKYRKRKMSGSLIAPQELAGG